MFAVQVPSVLRDRDWGDQSCVVGWAVAGLWANHHYPHPVSVESVHVGHNRWISRYLQSVCRYYLQYLQGAAGVGGQPGQRATVGVALRLRQVLVCRGQARVRPRGRRQVDIGLDTV